VHRMLHGDGLLDNSMPNVDNLEFKLFGHWWVPLDSPRHFYHFDKHSLSGLFAQAGFRLQRVRTSISAIFLMASLDRLWSIGFGKMSRSAK